MSRHLQLNGPNYLGNSLFIAHARSTVTNMQKFYPSLNVVTVNRGQHSIDSLEFFQVL